MKAEPIDVRLEKETQKRVDKLIHDSGPLYRNRSHVIECALVEFLPKAEKELKRNK
jgi:Arc/MetJ-type ribon-helix-helix transcriptional regulator